MKQSLITSIAVLAAFGLMTSCANQEGINDDNNHPVRLDHGHHQEGYSCEERDDDKEVDNGDQAGCFSIAVT